jgi:hypothetical protein
MKKSFTTELPASTPWCGGPAPPLRPLASHHAARRTPARAAHRDGLQLAGGSCRPGAVSRRGCVACSYARGGPRLSARGAATGTGAAGKPLGLIVCPPTAAARASTRHAQLRGSRRGDTCSLPVSRRPLQESMRDCHGLQCGYCTPGILMTMKAFLGETPAPDEAQIREALSGNLCRCTGYQHIVEAMKLAAERLRR